MEEGASACPRILDGGDVGTLYQNGDPLGRKYRCPNGRPGPARHGPTGHALLLNGKK
jgi:hypothetical protein